MAKRARTSHRHTTGSHTQWSAARLLHTGGTRSTAYSPARHRVVHRDLWDSAGDYSDM